MKKKIVSLSLVLTMLVTLCVPAFATTEEQDNFPENLAVVFDDADIYLADTVAIQNEQDNSPILFQRDHLNFYSTKNMRFSDNFRLVLQDDGTVIPVEAVELNLSQEDPTSILTEQYGYTASDQLVRDINEIISSNTTNVESIVVYTTPNARSGLAPGNYTTTYKGKTVKTVYLEVDGNSGSGGQVIARHRERGVETYDDLMNISCEFKDPNSWSFRSGSLLLTVAAFFGKALLRDFIKEWNDPSSTTKDYVSAVLNYTNIMRYTSVVDNGYEYLGCISNRVYVDCNLVYYPVGAGKGPEVSSQAELSDNFQSNYYNNNLAVATAYNNYLGVTFQDTIDAITLKVNYPNGSTKSFSTNILK